MLADMRDIEDDGGGCRADDCAACDSPRRAFLGLLLGSVSIAFAAGQVGIGERVFALAAGSGEPHGNERRYPLPMSDGVIVDRASQVMLARYHGQVVALAIACPHQQAAVRWLPGEQRFQCSKHDSKYQPTGTYTSGRATRNLDRFPIRRDGDTIVVDAARVFQSDKDQAGWAAAVVPV
jgi:nitrite reductase/ring-hydroxylating ferredoxin subunit